jgi:hypothetical protein
MPTWSVECTGACSATGKPESNICMYGADPCLDISHMLMSLRVERLIARILSRDCSSCLSEPSAFLTSMALMVATFAYKHCKISMPRERAQLSFADPWSTLGPFFCSMEEPPRASIIGRHGLWSSFEADGEWGG